MILRISLKKESRVDECHVLRFGLFFFHERVKELHVILLEEGKVLNTQGLVTGVLFLLPDRCLVVEMRIMESMEGIEF